MISQKTRAFFCSKTIYIVGGSEGIGLATARGAVSLGAHVVTLSRDQHKLDEALKQMESCRQQPAQVLASAALDITNETAIDGVLNSLLIRYGAPDILINCAGYAFPGYLQDVPLEEIRRMTEVNYFGMVHATKAVLPVMIQRQRGHIVNVSSMAGYLGLFGYTGYCASKFAVIGFSRALQQEVRSMGIVVSVLCPPNTRTPGLERENKNKPAEILKLEERAGIVDADTVARALLRALPDRPFLIHPTLQSRLIYHGSRLFPGITEYFTRRP